MLKKNKKENKSQEAQVICAIEQTLVNDYNLKQEFAKNLVQIFFDEISIALICGDKIELRGFGSMVMRIRGAKIITNPKSKIQMTIGNKGVICFKTSTLFNKAINKSNLLN